MKRKIKIGLGVLSKPKEIGSTVKWNGRYIYLDLEVEFEGDELVEYNK